MRRAFLLGVAAIITACGSEPTAPDYASGRADRPVGQPPINQPGHPARRGPQTYTAGMVMWRSDTGTYVQATQNAESTYVWVELQRIDGSTISDTFTRVPDAAFQVGGHSGDWSLAINDLAVTWTNNKHWTRPTAKVITEYGDSGMVSGSVHGKPLTKYDQAYLMIEN